MAVQPGPVDKHHMRRDGSSREVYQGDNLAGLWRSGFYGATGPFHFHALWRRQTKSITKKT